MIVLGDWTSTGGPDIHYDEGFMANLPDYLRDSWPQGSSCNLRIIRWQELAASTP
jgi:hypothetical protein